MHIPFSDSGQVKTVVSFQDLIETRFAGDINAIGWLRNLEGDFEEIVSKLELGDNITEVSAATLLALPLSEQGDVARETILNDLKLLKDCGAQPTLNLIRNYQRDHDFDFISTDVYSFHVDRSPIEADTFLCTYYGASSDIIPNHQVVQKILIPEVRQKLKEIFDGDESEFESFLEENFFDLHYQALPGAQPINLSKGHLWKLAVDHPEQKVLPCVHRAPIENAGEYRLLLIC